MRKSDKYLRFKNLFIDDSSIFASSTRNINMKYIKLLPVVLITALMVGIFSKDYLFELNSRYFSAGGDGLKSYYCAWYHAQYDSDAHHFMGMNHPWGESINFTDGQPPVANFVRWIDQNVVPCAHKIPGIFNFLMLFSIVLSAAFLFLILKRFKLPDWYATLVAVAIAFLSPQIGRMPGHFSLSWGFWIPLLIYLILLIEEKPSWLKSGLFATATLLASLMHMYFFLFSVALLGIYWLNRIFIKRDIDKYGIELLHFTIQIVVPFAIIQFLMIDEIADRGMHPYGFYAYRAYPGSIFLPVNKAYAPFISKLGFVRKYEWESLAYVGLIASLGFWIGAFAYFKRLITKSESSVFTKDEKHPINILFWSGFLLLLFSFGIPFILGLEKLRNSIGFLSQLRAVGRFAWLFYYAINILVWIAAYRWIAAFKHKIIRYSVFILILAIAGFEAYDYSKRNLGILNNTIPELTDTSNTSEDNQWTTEINATDFQAILPIPHFHIGSESTWIEARCGIDKQMYIASLKTGLPCTGVMMGRTSLSQTYKNVAISKLPWKNYPMLDELPSQKPFLVLVAHCDELNADEKRILAHASFIKKAPNFDMYSLEIDSLRALPTRYNFPQQYQNMLDSIKQSAADSIAYYNQSAYLGSDETTLNLAVSKEFQRILETPSLKLNAEQSLYVRFWVRNYVHDLVPRTQLLVIQSAPDHQTLDEKYTDIFRHLRTFDADWALVEIEIQPKQEREIIKLLFKNPTLSGTEFQFKDFTVSQLPFGKD